MYSYIVCNYKRQIAHDTISHFLTSFPPVYGKEKLQNIRTSKAIMSNREEEKDF